MRLIALVPIVLAVSASALSPIAFERGLGNNARQNPDSDPQTSPTLDPRVISTNFEQDGSANATAGQEPSLTSSNNFINFCLTVGVNLPLTNGQQSKVGSCNTAPMGVLAPSTNMPSSKFLKPKNLDPIKAHTTFEIKMAVSNLDVGHFTNPDTTYYGAPQQLNSGNDIMGHTHFVIEKLSSVSSTDMPDPSNFVYFTAVSTAADDEGNVSVNMTNGLPAGTYKLSSINTSANHAPVLVAVAQHGALDDQVYVRVSLYAATYFDTTFLGLQFFVTKNGKRPKKFV
ncbi:hypothetical protein F5888DRAFT_1802437 [Russula emetica]|nr:hypothetical protein F5888DRAFT_1802437 [Russula emetica]